MSKSIRKNPFIDIGCTFKNEVSRWKKRGNRTIHRIPLEVNMKTYKKFIEQWDAPNVGKRLDYSPKGYRK